MNDDAEEAQRELAKRAANIDVAKCTVFLAAAGMSFDEIYEKLKDLQERVRNGEEI